MPPLTMDETSGSGRGANLRDGQRSVTHPFPSTELLGVRIDRVSHAELVGYVKDAVRRGHSRVINNVNVHAMNLAHGDPDFRMALNRSDLVFVDGFGVKLAARILGKDVGERLTPMDWLDEIFASCSAEGWPVFLLGDEDEQGARFQATLARMHPQCPFAGRHHGFFQRTGAENARVVDMINHSGARMLLVGMSMPIQEKWLWDNRDRLRVPVRISTGGFHRVYTGDIARGPRWMTQSGLEWLYRLGVQPGKTWRRYVLGNPLFLSRVLLHRLGLRRSRAANG